MRAWLAARSRSERILLVLGAAVVIGALYLLLVLEPLARAHAWLSIRVAAATELAGHLAEVREEVARLRARADTRVDFPADQALSSVVTSSARDAGVQAHARRMTPQGDDAVALFFDDVPFERLAAWLVELELEHGVEVERATIEAAAAAGVVDAQLNLKARVAKSRGS